MVHDKKQFQSSKKPMSQDLDRKSPAQSADKADRSVDSSRPGNMKQADLKNRPGIFKKDTGSRK